MKSGWPGDRVAEADKRGATLTLAGHGEPVELLLEMRRREPFVARAALAAQLNAAVAEFDHVRGVGEDAAGGGPVHPLQPDLNSVLLLWMRAEWRGVALLRVTGCGAVGAPFVVLVQRPAPKPPIRSRCRNRP